MNGKLAITVVCFSMMQNDVVVCVPATQVSLAAYFCGLCLYFHLNIFADIEGMASEKA